MALIINKITTDVIENGTSGEQKLLSCSFYLPFMREGAAYQITVDEFPPEAEREEFLRQSIRQGGGMAPELRREIQKAIAEEKAYLQAKIRTHDEQKLKCQQRLEVLNKGI